MKRFPVLASAAALFFALFGASALAQEPAAQGAPAMPAVASPAETAAIARILRPYAAASDDCLAALGKAVALSSQGKWMSAFQAVDDFDKANADPFALAMKTSLVLRGAVRTDMDTSFGLADLEQGQDLETLRNTEGDYAPISLDPPALADAQATKGIAPPGILSKELGDYYYDVIGRFSGQWSISDEEILAKVVGEYEKADEAGVFDGTSLINHAVSLVRLDRGDESDSIYRRAIALDSRDSSVRYSYALSLSFRGKKVQALVEIDRAIESYGEDPARIDAIALGAKTATELGDAPMAQAYYSLADKYYPDSPTSGILRHMIAVETGDKVAAAAAADGLVPKYGSNPNVVRNLVSSWYSAGGSDDARAFLERNAASSSDDLTVGTLDFYLAVLLSQDAAVEASKAAALQALDAAEARFKAKLEPDNEVFGVIANIRNSLEQPAPPEDAVDSPGPVDTPSGDSTGE